MHSTLQAFLASITSLHQLEPKNLPQEIVQLMVQMSPEELFKTCSQLAILRHNVPTQEHTITLSENEIASLAEAYLKDLIKRFR